MGGPYCETCEHGYFPVADSIHGECGDPTKQIDTGGHSSSCSYITLRSECQNHTGLTVQAAPSEREKRLEQACKEVLSTPSIGALRDAAAVDTIRIVRAALAKTTNTGG